MSRHLWIIAALGLLSACGQQPYSGPVPKGVKVGNPYVINGKTYYPAYDDTYDKIGTASWYGPGFHGKRTANGEIYDQNALTAAHPTLPMPSIVRVTNLENGKSLIVRINDRGPFKANRIIDMSKKSAQELGFKGLAKVRVQFLKPETEEYIANLQRDNRIDMASYNRREKHVKDAAVAASTAPEAQIVESTVSNSQYGQTVVDAAPVMSVGSAEVMSDNSIRVSEVNSVEAYEAKRANIFIKDAAADDNVDGYTTTTSNISGGGNNIASEPEPGAVVLSSQDPAPVKITTQAETPIENTYQPSAGPKDGYFIQAGSFSSEGNAQKLSDRLSMISRVNIERVDMSGRVWWRVRVGPFDNKAAANTKLAEVRSSGVPDARIVRQ